MPPIRTPRRAARGDADAGRIAENRARQCEIYGAPLGERVRVLTAALGVTQARLAGVLGVSAAMLSQLASGRRCKIGDPDALARLQALEERCAALARPPTPDAAAALLDDVARVQWRWAAVGTTGPAPAREPVPEPRARPAPASPPVGASAAEALRRIAAPARLAAAAAALGPGFPELAEVLRQAAGRS